MTDIRAFIEARLAEREALLQDLAAQFANRGEHMRGGWNLWGDFGRIVDRLTQPLDLLKDVAVKRAILDQHAGANGLCGRCVERWDYHHDGCEECVDEPHETPVMYVGRPCPTVLLLAQPFRLHPEFDPTWRMEP